MRAAIRGQYGHVYQLIREILGVTEEVLALTNFVSNMNDIILLSEA